MSGPEQIRLLDQLSLGAVMATYPRYKVERILQKTKTGSVRHRLLPSFLVVYLVIVMCLYSDVSSHGNH